MIDPPTEPQVTYVRGLQQKLRLPNRMLDAHCVARTGRPFAEITKRECTALTDDLLAWKAIPTELLRAQGQRDLPGFGV